MDPIGTYLTLTLTRHQSESARPHARVEDRNPPRLRRPGGRGKQGARGVGG